MGSCFPKEIIVEPEEPPSMSVATKLGSGPQSLYNVRIAMTDALLVGGFMGARFLFEEKVRRAKQESKTVTVVDGCLFIDYEYQGRIPPGTNIFV